MDRVRPEPSILQVLVTAIVGVALLAYLIISFNTGDLLWFVPTFEGMPASITVHCYGEDVRVNPGNPSFQAMNDALNEILSGSKRWDQLSMSDITYAEYQDSSEMMVMELTYDPPTRIHSFYKFFKNVDIIIIPLDGRHASTNTIFGQLRGNMIPGSLHVDSMQPLRDVLAQESVCNIQ